ncbi:SPFH domain-containing protein [Culicoidibacter larvae]|uniref:SPFH domain-containing protein n=1 Tax=Culicoidibacter larvae TaxID=2579976 RepID=A0A5R8Q752_9FIRM|nr:SPFH domain-containing protein [Culicoidibacter larvae]TLG71226.1 hypothetical protein FEZ08_11265 [Culicoidibacter larvae]
MGLIKMLASVVGNAGSAIDSTLEDQWKKAIRCNDMGNEILMQRVTPENGVLANKSMIVVGPGQMAVVYDNGRVVDATAEEGMYTYDTSATPSFFAGQFGPVFKQMWERFTYGGERARQQAVFYFNTKEIIDNKFGSPAPIPYRDFEHVVMNARTGGYIPMRLEIKCFGKYTFKITDPALFMQVIGGTADRYTKTQINEQMRSEVIGAFTNVLNGLGSEEYKIPALSLPSKSLEIKRAMDEHIYDQAIRDRGLNIVSFVVESVTLDEESEKKIDTYEIGGDIYQQKGTLTDAYGKAVQDAAKNENGAINTFMGMGMMGAATGGVVAGTAGAVMNDNSMPKGPEMQAYDPNPTQPKAAEQSAEPTEAADIACNNCGETVNGKFCSNCGTEAPTKKKFCPECGTEATGKFCSNCGTEIK